MAAQSFSSRSAASASDADDAATAPFSAPIDAPDIADIGASISASAFTMPT
jgi:hypothetical protein